MLFFTVAAKKLCETKLLVIALFYNYFYISYLLFLKLYMVVISKFQYFIQQQKQCEYSKVVLFLVRYILNGLMLF